MGAPKDHRLGPGGENLTRDGTPRIRARPHRATVKKPKKKAPWGKHTGNMLLSRAVMQRVVDRIDKGCDRNTAMRASGATKVTTDQWERKAARGIEPYRTFIDRVDEEIAIKKARYLELIAENAERDTTDAKWMLEKFYPDQFGKQSSVNINVNRDVTQPTPEELENITELLRSGATYASLPSDITATEADYEEVHTDNRTDTDRSSTRQGTGAFLEEPEGDEDAED